MSSSDGALRPPSTENEGFGWGEFGSDGWRDRALTAASREEFELSNREVRKEKANSDTKKKMCAGTGQSVLSVSLNKRDDLVFSSISLDLMVCSINIRLINRY